MSLPDPFTIAASAPTPALVMAVVKPTPKLNGLIRVDATGAYEITITHDRDKKTGERHVVKVAETKDATNPYTGGLSRQTAFVSVVLQFPSFGWDATQKAALYKALTDTIADTEVTIAKILQDQS